MILYKIIALAIITSFLCVYLKNISSDFFMPVLLTGGALILLVSVEYLRNSIGLFNELFLKTGIDSDIFKLIIKITLIAYLIEFSCSLVEDFGFKSLSDKLAFAGKIILFTMSFPVLQGLLQVITAFLN